jgi:PHP family Zn ribbon phosphoesterase
MKAAYDFHLHSCLSPCGDKDMTPRNITNLAKLMGLDIIALTDHNSCKNCAAAVKAGAEIGLAVVPGMELCTAEEIHVICLFPDAEAAEAFSEAVRRRMPPVKNRPDIFGEQTVLDADDAPVETEGLLLLSASDIPLNEAPALVRAYGGFCYPSHIDRESFSLLSTLGGFPPEPGFACAELSPRADTKTLVARYPELGALRFMRSSDAHYLEDMAPARDTLELPELSAAAAICALRAWIKKTPAI